MHGGVLTALTQYTDLCCLPHVAAPGMRTLALVEKKLRACCFAQLSANMVKLKDSLLNYVVDFVLVPTATAMPTPAGPGDPTAQAAQAAAAAAGFAAAVRMQAADARVIEINPFVEFAGSGLYSRISTRPRDVGVVTGKRPLGPRVVAQPPGVAVHHVCDAWRAFCVSQHGR